MLLKQLKDLINEYEQYCHAKGFAKESIELRILLITKFIEYMDKIYINPPKNIEYINDEHVNSFLKWKEKQGYSIYSIDNYFKNIKYFFDYMYDNKSMKNPVLRNIPGPIVDRDKYDRQYDFFTKEEMLKIIDTARGMKENNKDFISFRNYTIILLLSYSGMTSKELRNLKDDDIDFENQLITVKGKERRAFYLNSVMNSMLYSYIQLKNKKSKSEFAFPSRENKQLSKESLQRLVRNIVLEGEISSKNRELSPNTIRH
jgi:integrase/recombinase XerD